MRSIGNGLKPTKRGTKQGRRFIASMNSASTKGKTGSDHNEDRWTSVLRVFQRKVPSICSVSNLFFSLRPSRWVYEPALLFAANAFCRVCVNLIWNCEIDTLCQITVSISHLRRKVLRAWSFEIVQVEYWPGTWSLYVSSVTSGVAVRHSIRQLAPGRFLMQ